MTILSRLCGCFRHGLVLPALLMLVLPQTRGLQGQQAAVSRPTSTPYTGDLSIFETPGRDQRLQIQRIMDLLAIHPGSNVADIGAGSGWFTVRAAARVKPSGMVYAEDINPEAIDYIRKRAAKEKLANIDPILGSADDPKLPAGSIDAVLMLKAYHEIEHPEALLDSLKPALRPGARFGIVDRNGDGADHGIMPEVVQREMQQAGFRLVKTYDFTKADGQDYFQIYEWK